MEREKICKETEIITKKKKKVKGKKGIKKKESKEKIVAKALDGQRYPLPLCQWMRV